MSTAGSGWGEETAGQAKLSFENATPQIRPAFDAHLALGARNPVGHPRTMMKSQRFQGPVRFRQHADGAVRTDQHDPLAPLENACGGSCGFQQPLRIGQERIHASLIGARCGF